MGVVYKACLRDVECVVVVPKVEDYPRDILEVIAPIYLRGALGLKDGDSATVTITV